MVQLRRRPRAAGTHPGSLSEHTSRDHVQRQSVVHAARVSRKGAEAERNGTVGNPAGRSRGAQLAVRHYQRHGRLPF